MEKIMKKLIYCLLISILLLSCSNEQNNSYEESTSTFYDSREFQTKVSDELLSASSRSMNNLISDDESFISAEEYLRNQTNISIGLLSLINEIERIVKTDLITFENKIQQITILRNQGKLLNLEESLYLDMSIDTAISLLKTYQEDCNSRGFWDFFTSRVCNAIISGVIGAVAGAIVGYAIGGIPGAIAFGVSSAGACAAMGYNADGIAIGIGHKS